MNLFERHGVAAYVVARNFRNVLRFRHRMGHWPRVLRPRTYNEKMFWRKLFDHNPIIARLSDKLEVKRYFVESCPDLKVVKPLWIGSRAQDIPDEVLKQDVIVKTNHGSGYNIIMQGTTLDRAALNETVNGWLDTTYGAKTLEWGYGAISPKVYVEPMLRPDAGHIPFDFNFEVCGGKITTCFVMGDKASGHAKIGIFDEEGHRLATTVASVPDPQDQLPQDTVMPPAYAIAAKYARALGRYIDNVRVDFMCVGDEIYGCEMTFYSKSGYGNVFSDSAQCAVLTDAWDLRKSWFLRNEQTGWRARYAADLSAHLETQESTNTKEAHA